MADADAAESEPASVCKCAELRMVNPKYTCPVCRGHSTTPSDKAKLEADIAANRQRKIDGKLGRTLEVGHNRTLPTIDGDKAESNPFASSPYLDEADGPAISSDDRAALEKYYKAELKKCFGFAIDKLHRGFPCVSEVELGTWAETEEVQVGWCLVGYEMGGAEPIYTTDLCALMGGVKEEVQCLEPRDVQLVFVRAHQPTQCYSLSPDDAWDKDFDVRYALAVEGGRYIHKCGGSTSTCFKVTCFIASTPFEFLR